MVQEVPTIQYFFDRSKEPTTCLALGILLEVFGVNQFPEGLAQALAELVSFTLMGFGVLLRERASK